jgi:DNA processing protein
LARRHDHHDVTTADAVDRLRLARAEGVGPVAYRRLLARYGSAAASLDALPNLARAGGRASAPAIPTADEAARELHTIEHHGARAIFLDEHAYPPLLALLEDAPPVITVLGDPAVLSERSIALVGGRNASANGQRVAENLATELASSLVVVSGLARGIDAAAHTGAWSLAAQSPP